uniref:Nucleolar complex protein 2 homolog n=1 Tax=Magallana gigas TaxID=29159 RepID=A0A8W8K8T2_MAGGI|nr:nucleolar complex protein 2 homolog [Crassostrea gigas]
MVLLAEKMKKKRKLADMNQDVVKASSKTETAKSTKAKIPSKNVKKNKKKSQAKAEKLEDKLKAQDPEFYEFLKNEDESLLNFDESDEDLNEEDDIGLSDESSDDETQTKTVSVKGMKGKVVVGKKRGAKEEDLDDILSTSEDEDSEEEESDTETGGKFHKLPSKLEVASDEDEDEEDQGEEDEEEDEATKPKGGRMQGTLVTVKMISHWSKALEEKPSASLIKDVICAFKAAVKQAGHETEVNKYRVEGSKVFNGIVRLCLAHMSPALHKVTGVPQTTDLQKPVLPNQQSKKWKTVKLDTKTYLTHLLHLLGEMTESTMLNVILKHVHRLVAFYSVFPKLVKLMMKKMISMWSKGEETTRVLAFLCLNKVVLISKKSLLEPCMKAMYMSYVKNSKFTSPTTIPLINFMQMSMVEIFAIDLTQAYQHAFIYIRQLAIHLRNAITVKKKENCQAVYNWQFVRCLEFWVRLLSSSHPSEALRPLIYPLTQTILGTIKLIPTARYYPLRFHLVRALNRLSKATDTYIPVLPLILEVLEQTDFNKRHKTVSLKPFNFACILKFSKAQLQEKAFKDGLIDQLYELLLEQLHVHASSVGFPELVLPGIIQLRDFLKKCKVANYCKQIKQIVDKVDDNTKFINNRRKSANIKLSDTKAVAAWERECREAGTPLDKFYNNWRKLRDVELQHQIAQKDLIVGVDEMPRIERQRGPIKASEEDKKEFGALFDESDSDDDTRFLLKEERPVKKQKTSHGDSSDESQDYSDFDSDELEILARSGDEDSDEEFMDDGENNEEGGSNDDDDDDMNGVDEEEEGEEGEDSNEDESDELEDIDDKEDIVKNFELSDSD